MLVPNEMKVPMWFCVTWGCAFFFLLSLIFLLTPGTEDASNVVDSTNASQTGWVSHLKEECEKDQQKSLIRCFSFFFFLFFFWGGGDVANVVTLLAVTLFLFTKGLAPRKLKERPGQLPRLIGVIRDIPVSEVSAQLYLDADTDRDTKED